MSNKRILIVDDEESILTVLKNSLRKIGPNYQIVAVTDGFTALGQILEEPFDVVVTDYNMDQMDGLELAEAIRYAQPNTQLIMITAYGNDFIEAEARRLHIYRYLTKPLEINTFRQIVLEALGNTVASQPKHLILSDSQYQQINTLLTQLRADVSARCIFLADANGHIITRTGDTDKLAIENITSLLGGGIATLMEAGRTMDGDTDTFNLAYREGKNEDLYALNVGYQLLLILVINRGPYSSRLGSVWYHARQAAITLSETLAKTEQAAPHQVFDQELDQAFEMELDRLFGGNDFIF